MCCRLLPLLLQITNWEVFVYIKTYRSQNRADLFLDTMRTITSVASALARRHYPPQQRLMMMSYCCHTNTGGWDSHRSAVLLQVQSMPLLPPKFHQTHAVRTFAVQPTMIQYMPVQTIDVRRCFAILFIFTSIRISNMTYECFLPNVSLFWNRSQPWVTVSRRGRLWIYRSLRGNMYKRMMSWWY